MSAACSSFLSLLTAVASDKEAAGVIGVTIEEGRTRAAARRGRGGGVGETLSEDSSLGGPLDGVSGTDTGKEPEVPSCVGVLGEGRLSGWWLLVAGVSSGGVVNSGGGLLASDGAISDAALVNESCDMRLSMGEDSGEATVASGAAFTLSVEGGENAASEGMALSTVNSGLFSCASAEEQKTVSAESNPASTSDFSTLTGSASAGCPFGVGWGSGSSTGRAGLADLEAVVDRLRPAALFGNGGGLAPVGGDEGEDNFLSTSLSGVRPLSPSLQLAALSPNTVAIPHSPRLLGGSGGLPSPAESLLDDLIVAPDFGGGEGSIGTSSSQILSITPVRTKAHSEQVDRKRARHQPEVHNGYIVDCELRL